MARYPNGRARPAPALTAALVVAVLVTAQGLSAFGGEAAAQTASSPPTRVVFAIDNSGSMFGVAGEPASDPEAQRVAGVLSLIEVLRGFLGGPQEQRVIELGALSFGGDEPEVLSELTTVFDPRLPERLVAELAGGGTDFRAALCGAWTLAAREAPGPAAGCPEPSTHFLEAARAAGDDARGAQDGRLLVVLITDGSPAPDGADLAFDGTPSAGACAVGSDATADGDGDAYLCRLAATWQALRAQRAADLVVIGLDEVGQWFPAAEAYWQRVAQCGAAGQPPCDDRVVRTVDPGRMTELILRAFPGVDLCDLIASDDTFNCLVPGGLVSVRFQIVGLTDGSTSTVGNPDRNLYNSEDDPAELTRLADGTHIWRFEKPGAGIWMLAGAGQVSRAEPVKVIVDPDPARFDIEVRSWDERGLQLDLTLHQTAAGRVALASLLTQDYRVALLRQGLSSAEDRGVRLEHEGGESFSLTAQFAPPAGDNAEHEVVLYLRTLLTGRLRLPAIQPPPLTTATATPAAPTPDPTPAPAPPACSEFSASWQGEDGLAPRWRLALRLGFPLPLRARDSALWSVVIDSPDCASPIEGDATVIGCETCVASGEGAPPLTLEVPTGDLSGDVAERQVGWYAPSTGIEDARREEVRVVQSTLLYWEPVWATALHLLGLALLILAVSAIAVRSPRAWLGDQSLAPPIDLMVPDQDRRLVGIVRFGTVLWRRTTGDGSESGRRLLTLRWLIFGELVARNTSASGRSRWLGRTVADARGVDARRLDIRLRPAARRRR